MDVIVVPADESAPCRIEIVAQQDWRQAVRELLDASSLSDGLYDYDVLLQIDGEGATGYRLKPPNRRATRYAFGHSTAAARNHTDPDDPPYTLHGDVVVLGRGPDGQPLDEPPTRMRTLFGLD